MRAGFLCGLLAIAFSMLAQGSRSGTVGSAVGSFDAPLKTEVMDFGSSPYYSNPQNAPRIKLSCFYFPTFMVKEYDEGQKGAESLAIVPTGKGGAAPSCTRSHAPDEMVIEWWGYFEGVKMNLAFFNAPDGQDGGMPFAVFDSRSGKKIFEDVAYDSGFVLRQLDVSPFDRLRVSRGQDGSVSLKYLRVKAYDCDLHLPAEKSTCWEKIRVQAGLSFRQIPVCSGYERIHNQYWSAVAYPVEILLPGLRRRTIAGPVRCWPVD